MGIFDSFFGIDRKNYNMSDSPYVNVGDAVKEAQEKEKSRKAGMPAFQVGSTVDGRVTLTIGEYATGGTLTMTDGGVDQLIRMLEAAKQEHTYTEEDENT